MASDTPQPDRDLFEPPTQRINPKNRHRLVRAGQLLLLSILLVYVVFPVYWSVSSAFRTTGELFRRPAPLLPQSITFENIQAVLFTTDFPIWFQNSIIVAVATTILTTALAAFAGYGLTRATFGGKRTLARSVLFVYMFPPILLAIPLYMMFFRTNLLNSYFALVLSHTATALPFAIWIMWQYFQTISTSFEESAWINGASRIRTVWDVVLPMARPGLIAVAIISFAFSWNDYTLAVVIMTDGSMQTFPVGVNQFIQLTAIHWGLVQAAGFLIMLPAFVLVLFLQKYLLQGFGVTRL